MIYVSATAMLLLLASLIIRQKWGATTHPGFWFSSTWIISILAYIVLDLFDGIPVHNEDLLENLALLLLWACAIFLSLGIAFKKKQSAQERSSAVRPKLPSKYYLFSTIGLLGAMVNWATLGANFSYDDSIRQQWLDEIPRITALMWYLYFFTFPSAFVSGNICGGMFLEERRQSILQMGWLVLPLISALFWTLGTGGRQAFGLALFVFISGVCMGVSNAFAQGARIAPRKLLKLIAYGLLAALLFSLFVGLTGQSRAKQQNAQASVFDDYPMLAPIGQMISYAGLPLATHQAYGFPLRRDISETGPVTLAGLQYFGFRLITGWRPVDASDTNPERQMASSGQALASGTRNVFYDLQADFGTSGAYFAILVFAMVANWIWLHSRPRLKKITPYTPTIASIMFWGYSNQFSLLTHNFFFWLVLSFLLWDAFDLLVGRIFYKSRNLAR